MRYINSNPIAVNRSGTVFMSSFTNAIRDVNRNNTILQFLEGVHVSTFVGQSPRGSQDGVGEEATFYGPKGIVYFDRFLFVVDTFNYKIRKISADGTVTTFAGNGTKEIRDGTGTEASFKVIRCMTVDRAGNLYVADNAGTVIRKITPAGVVTTLNIDYSNLDESLLFDEIDYIAADRTGNLYFTSFGAHCIFKLTGNTLSILAGNNDPAGYADGTGNEASFNEPSGIVVGRDGNIYVADLNNHRIRKITPAGVVTTLAGDGGNRNTDGVGREASLNGPDYLTPPENPPLKDIETGSGDAISSDDIEEGSIVGQIVGEGGTIAKSSYYFPNSLNNLWARGLSKFKDPITRKPIEGVNWYTARLVPAGSLGGRKKTRKRNIKRRATFRKKRISKKSLKKKQ